MQSDSNSFKGLKLLASKDLQKILGVSRGYVQKIIDENIIPHQKTSAGCIFIERDVIEYQKKRVEKSKRDRRIRLRKD